MKLILGKQNPHYQQSVHYYNLYYTLPATIVPPAKRWIGFYFLVIILSLLSLLLLRVLVGALSDETANKNADYYTGVIAVSVIIVLFCLLIIYLFRLRKRIKKDDKTLQGSYRETSATILGKWYETNPNTECTNALLYFLAIAFNNMAFKMQVSSWIYYYYKINQPVKIRYVTFKPQVCEIV